MTKEDAIQELRDMLNGDIDEYGEEGSEYTCEAVEMAIEALQERKTGKWINHIEDGYVECPVCGHLTTCWNEDGLEDLHYCFWCGAKMTKEGGDEH